MSHFVSVTCNFQEDREKLNGKIELHPEITLVLQRNAKELMIQHIQFESYKQKAWQPHHEVNMTVNLLPLKERIYGVFL